MRGFTIVELVVVIAVIAILASISVVAYGGIQQRARDTARTSDIHAVQNALEMYIADNYSYPSVGNDNWGYPIANLSAALVPKYLGSIPKDPANVSATNYQYVRGASGTTYGIRIEYESRTPCHRGVGNTGLGWWGLSAC